MLSSQSKEFYNFFAQLIVAAMVFGDFFSTNYFRIFSLKSFSRKNAKFCEKVFKIQRKIFASFRKSFHPISSDPSLKVSNVRFTTKLLKALSCLHGGSLEITFTVSLISIFPADMHICINWWCFM